MFIKLSFSALFNTSLFLFFSLIPLSSSQQNITYEYTNMTSWEKKSFKLEPTNKFVIIKFSYPSQEKEKGDIVFFSSEFLSTASVCVYTDPNKIKQDEQGNFTDCSWTFTNTDTFVLKNTDKEYKFNSDYYFAVYIYDIIYNGDITIFNELDIKTIDANSKISLRGLYAHKKLTFQFTQSELVYLIFCFFFKEGPSKFKDYEGYIQIRYNDTEVKFKQESFDSQYFYYKEEQNSTLYYVDVVVSKPEYPVFILDIEIDTMAERPYRVEGNSTFKKGLMSNSSYYFYMDISDYEINEENTVEININSESVIEKTLVIYDGILECEETEIKNHYPTELIYPLNIRERPNPNGKIVELPFKRTNEKQKFFIVSLKYTETTNSGEFTFTFIPRPKYFFINEQSFTDLKPEDEGIITTDKISFTGKIPIYYKISFDKELLKDNNLVFYVTESKLSTIIVGNIINGTNQVNTDYLNNNVYILQKNSPIPYNNTITFYLVGEIYRATIKIAKVSSDILFFNKTRPIDMPFNVELLNCKKDVLLVESYEDNSEVPPNYLAISKLYGNYQLKHYNGIFSPKLTGTGTEISSNITLIEEPKNVIQLTCTTPTSLMFTYLKEVGGNNDYTLEDGDEKTLHIKVTGNIQELNFVLGNDNVSLMYKVTIEQTGKNVATAVTKINTQLDLKLIDNDIMTIDYVGSLDDSNRKLKLTISGTEVTLRIKFASNSLYNRIVEGNTDISFDIRRSLFKLKQDILYDYLQIQIFPKNGVDLIRMKYTFNKYHEKEYIPLPKNSREFSHSTVFTYSNPYNKFDSNINKDEIFYFSLEFLNKAEDYNIYIDIKYMSNEGIVIKTDDASMVKEGEAYRLVPQMTIPFVNKIVYNINSCTDISKNAITLKTFYNDANEYISKDEIIQKRQFIVHDLYYNGTTIKVESESASSEIYLNYFLVNDERFKLYDFTDNYTINYERSGSKIKLTWNNYTKDREHFPTKYYIYIYPNTSSVDTMCDFNSSLYNFTVDNITELLQEIPAGGYKVNIIAKSMVETLPFMTIYNSIDMTVFQRSNILLWTFIIVAGVVVLFIIVFYLLRMRKTNQRNRVDKDDDLALLKKEGFDEEKNLELFDNNEDTSRDDSHHPIGEINKS